MKHWDIKYNIKNEGEMMKTKQTIGLVVAVILFIVTGVASVMTNTVSELHRQSH